MVFGSFSPGKKIYRSAIENIPGHKFGRQVKMKTAAGECFLFGESLRDAIAALADNGVSLTTLEERLKKAGVGGDQYERRREIMRVIREEMDKNNSKSENN